MEATSRARVTEDHAPEPQWAARRVAAGEVVEIEREDPAWPDWVLCRLTDGGRAWLPKAELDVTGDSATLTAEFDTAELEVAADETVTLGRRHGGWTVCTTDDGRTGWVPDEKLAPVS